MPLESDGDKRRLFKYGILAFEHLRNKDLLSELEEIRAENLEQFAKITSGLDDIEASLYYQIVSQRLEVIEALRERVDNKGVLEAAIRDYIADHLWLLDPAWERATGSELVESGLQKEFTDIDGSLTTAERRGRYDIKYSTFSMTHVIIELKKPDVHVEVPDLMKQGNKYVSGLRKLLKQRERTDEKIEVVFLIGQPPRYWEDDVTVKDDIASLRAKGMRILFYKALLDNAERVYGEYLKARRETGKIQRVLESLERD